MTISHYYRTIVIYGVGLMGGSLAKTIRRLDPSVRLKGIVRIPNSREDVMRLGLVDECWTEDEWFGGKGYSQCMEGDLLVFGTPVHRIKEQIARLPLDARFHITDMGSTKKNIVDSVSVHFNKRLVHNYVSSHPMCGSELAGPENALDGLYHGKLCILTPIGGSSSESLESVGGFWKSIGMTTHTMDGENHDRVLAYLSHGPHILSSLMVDWAQSAVGDENSRSPQPIMGGGFRDMARIAGSNPEMWQAILSENRIHILESMRKFSGHLDSVIRMLEMSDKESFAEFFHNADRNKSLLMHRQQTRENQ